MRLITTSGTILKYFSLIGKAVEIKCLQIILD